MLEEMGITGVLIPYAVLSAAIAALVLGLRNSIERLEKSKILSSLTPLILGAIAGYCFPEFHPKGTTATMGALYGLLAGSFSAPIYHAIRRLVAMKLKGNSKNPKGGMETTFAADTSAPHIPAIRDRKKAQEIPAEKKPEPLTKDENE